MLLLAACGSDMPTILPTTPAGPGTVVTVTSGSNSGATPVPPTPQQTLPPVPPASTPASTPVPTVSNARPPGQPATGPGGIEKKYGSVVTTSEGSDEHGYYIFEPSNPKPTEALPVVALLHGYVGLNLRDYQLWIDHIVERGNIVIFPLYQTLSSRDGEQYADNAADSLKRAFTQLQDGTHVRPDLTRFSIVGYSAGGVIATNLTAQAARRDLPVPKALFAVSPGGCSNCSILAIRNFTLAQPSELAAISPDTKLLVMVGDRDTIVGRSAGDIIWDNTAQIGSNNRNYLLAQTDAHGLPTLVADHGMATRRPPDAHNYLGIWKLFDALQSCSLNKKDCEYALGGTPQQLSLGQWSDGTPVLPFKLLG